MTNPLIYFRHSYFLRDIKAGHSCWKDNSFTSFSYTGSVKETDCHAPFILSRENKLSRKKQAKQIK